MYLEVSEEGRVTLSREVLAHLDAGPGDRVTVELHSGGRVQIRAASKRPVSSIFGRLRRDGEAALTIETISEITEQGWAGED
jgi:antitoxin component of MazEF toxin-antitoxin module